MGLRRWWRRLTTPAQSSRRLLGGGAAIVLGIVLISTAAFCGATAFLQVPPEPTPTPTSTPTASATATSTSEPTPTPVPSNAPISRIEVPAIGVNAPIVVLGVDANGVMQTPSGAFDVAWYTFSSLPGNGGNIVMAGHVDYITVGPAVFYGLGGLGNGSEVRLRTADGKTHTYRVVSNTMYHLSNVPIQEVVGPTGVESVTLITCGGSYDPSSYSYDSRIVVRAERVG